MMTVLWVLLGEPAQWADKTLEILTALSAVVVGIGELVRRIRKRRRRERARRYRHLSESERPTDPEDLL